MPTKPVAIIMGSQSDWATMRHAAETLEALGVAYDSRIVSAHRTPDRLVAYAKARARPRASRSIIAGAGGAAHLPGMTAAMTPLPVLGVPVEVQGADGHGLAAVDRADAGRRPGRHAGDRQGRRDQRGAARRRRSWRSRDAALAARLEAWRAAQTERGRRTAVDRRPTTARSLAPGATIGILGGGQLGRMLAMAAARLGYRAMCSAAGAGCPAGDVARDATVAAYDDEAALRRASPSAVDVVTFEFENVPARHRRVPR